VNVLQISFPAVAGSLSAALLLGFKRLIGRRRQLMRCIVTPPVETWGRFVDAPAADGRYRITGIAVPISRSRVMARDLPPRSRDAVRKSEHGDR
jgi:hypothetical protein